MTEKLSPIELFEMALAECLLKWAIFQERELRFFEWAWEFLRRNSYYIRAYERNIERCREKNERLSDFLEKQKTNSVIAQIPLSHFEAESERLTMLEQLEALQFGLTVFLSPESEISMDNLWACHLAPKAHSDLRFLMAYNWEERSIKDFKFEDDERFMMINLKSPKKPYDDELERIFAASKIKRKTRMSVGRDIDKYPEYIMAYDLYMWGMQEDRCIKKKGKVESCIQIKYIADYLHSLKSPDDNSRKATDSGIISNIGIARNMIYGGYKELLEVKGTV